MNLAKVELDEFCQPQTRDVLPNFASAENDLHDTLEQRKGDHCNNQVWRGLMTLQRDDKSTDQCICEYEICALNEKLHCD